MFQISAVKEQHDYRNWDQSGNYFVQHLKTQLFLWRSK